MKMKYHYYVIGEKILYPMAEIVNSEKYDKYYSVYLAHSFDVMGKKKGKEILDNIEKMEKEFYEYGHELFDYTIHKDKVYFEYFFETPKHEDWSCPTIEYKKALIGWIEFLGMKRDKNTYFEVEINEL